MTGRLCHALLKHHQLRSEGVENFTASTHSIPVLKELRYLSRSRSLQLSASQSGMILDDALAISTHVQYFK
jgi:hypothetical protein